MVSPSAQDPPTASGRTQREPRSHALATSPSRRGRGSSPPRPLARAPRPLLSGHTPSRAAQPIEQGPRLGRSGFHALRTDIFPDLISGWVSGKRRPVTPPPAGPASGDAPPGTRPAAPSPLDQPGPLAPGRKAALPRRPDRGGTWAGRGEPWVAAPTKPPGSGPGAPAAPRAPGRGGRSLGLSGLWQVR